MRNTVLVLLACIAALVLARPVAAQLLSAERIFGATVTNKALGGEAKPEEVRPRNVFMLLPIVPLTFNTLEKDDETGEYRLGASMTLGVGATFILGKARWANQLASVTPWIMAGGALNAGIREGEDRSVDEAVTVSGFFGFGDVALMFSRDVLGGDTSLGLAVKVEALNNLTPDTFMCFRGCQDNR